MEYLKRVILVFVGVTLMGMGIAISALNNWGVDPITVFAQAISNILTNKGMSFFTIGNTLICMNLIVFSVLLVIYKMKYVNIGTFAGMFCVGLFTDMWMKILTGVVHADNVITLKVIWLLIGVIVFALGIGMYVSGDIGASPLDLISVTISEKFNFKYSIVRMICDLSFMVVGWGLGGVVGINTVFCMFLIGPISGFIIKNIRQYLKL